MAVSRSARRASASPGQPRAEGGFILAEVLIALGLGSLVIAGALAFQVFAVRRQGEMVARARLSAQGVGAYESARRALAAASRVVLPAAGAASTDLLVHLNDSPLGDGGAILAGRPRRYRRVCLRAGPPAAVYSYEGSLPAAVVPCGQPPRSSDEFSVVAGDPGREAAQAARVAMTFYRSAGNQVTFQYAIQEGPVPGRVSRRVYGATTVQTQGAL
ncbi:MAG: hypothetical protein HY928_01930 [Elusimicrobia bacterium]|nr:hypothetical protein [Elusimicrobiota bacterium]